MHYFSTRGGVSSLSFTQAVMMGLAEDGGLLLPRTIPRIGSETLEKWSNLPYDELAFEVMSRFIDDIPASDLKALIEKSYSTFSHKDVTPLVKHENLYILELFHGPTLAFKDVALQFLGNLFEYLLAKNEAVLNILGATSGDTGSAAIYGVKGKKNIKIFILHPHKRVSPVQEKQMTTVIDDNVFNIAINGTFDDGQTIVKSIFNDVNFKKDNHLGSINSINWARVLAQVVYYVYSCLQIKNRENIDAIDFAVPTGNFGDIFAGYIAKKMLPGGRIRHLILATNTNDILSRFVANGDYSLGSVTATLSPSMDIQAASNFERYLYYLVDSETEKTKRLMEQFLATGKLDLSSYKDQISRDFLTSAVSEEETLAIIRDFKEKHGYLIDPHTAVGVKAAQEKSNGPIPVVCLATAHPAKFGDAVKEATGEEVVFPPALQGILDSESRCEIKESNTETIKEYIKIHV